MNNSNNFFITRSQNKVPIKVLDMDYCALIIYADEVILSTEKEDKKLNIDSDKIVNATCNDGTVYILLKTNSGIQIHEVKNSITIYSSNIEINNKALLSFTNVGLCLTDKDFNLVYVSLSSSSIKLPDNTISLVISKVIKLPSINLGACIYSVNNCEYIPINNTDKMIEVDSFIAKIVDINSESIFNMPSSVFRGGGELTSQEDIGIASLIINSKNILYLDIIEKEAITVNIFDGEYKYATKTDNGIYVIAGHKLCLIDKFSLEPYSYSINISGGDYKIYSVANKIYIYSSSKHYLLEECDNKAIITIYGIDGSGDIIGVKEIVRLRESVMRVQAPLFEGYSLTSDTDYIDIQEDGEFYNVNFEYAITKTLCCVEVVHKTYAEELSSEFLYGLLGEKYSASQKRIEGYSFSHSSGNSGIFEQDSNRIFFYYIENGKNFDSILDLSIESTNGLIRRGIPISSGEVIKAPDVSFHVPVNNSFIIPSSNFTLIFDKQEYTPTCEVKRVAYKYNNTIIYEDFCKIEDDNIILNVPDNFIVPSIPNQNLGAITIDVNLSKKAALTRIMDEFSGKIISKYLLFDIDKSIIPSIDNYEFTNMSSYDSGKLRINNIYFKKIESSIQINFMDIHTKEILVTKNVTGFIGSTYTVTSDNIDNYTPLFNNINITFSYDDRVEYFYYSKDYISISYIYVDIHLKKEIDRDFYIFKDGVDTMPKLKDYNIVLSEVPEKTPTKSTSYTIFVSQNEYKPISILNGYTDKKALISVLSSAHNEQRLISILSSTQMNNDIYVLEPSYSSTLDFLSDNDIEYTLTKDIPKHNCILINGDIDTLETIEIKDIPNNILYIPLNVKYNNLVETLLLAKKSVINDSYIPLSPKNNVDILYSIAPTSLDLSNNLTITINVDHKKQSSEKYSVSVFNPITLEAICVTDFKALSTPSFNKIFYAINKGSYLTTDNNNIVMPVDKSYIVSFTIDFYAKDAVGNESVTASEYVQMYVKDVRSANVISKAYRPSVSRVNNRYKGPKESLKYINFYDGIDRAISDLENLIEYIIKGDFENEI